MCLVESGVDVAEIGERFRRSPEHIARVITLARLPGRTAHDAPERLRPLERCILGWRVRGTSHSGIGPRFGRTPDFIALEGLAQYKLSAGARRGPR